MLTSEQQLAGWLAVGVVVVGGLWLYLRARDWVANRTPDPLAPPEEQGYFENHVSIRRMR